MLDRFGVADGGVMRRIAGVLAAAMVILLSACSDSSGTQDQINALEERVTGLEGRTWELGIQLTEAQAALEAATSEATTPTLPPTTTTTTGTSAPAMAWTRVPHDETIFGGSDNQEMAGVAVAGAGLVAFGSDSAGGDRDAAVWTSPDGMNWTRVPHDEAIFGGSDDQEIGGAAVAGPGLIAVGYDGSTGDGDAAVWTSTDGMSWTRVAPTGTTFGGTDTQAMESVVAIGGGSVAVGYDYSGGDGDVAVWTSPDGIRVPHDEAIFGGAGHQTMRDVTMAGVRLVAVGSDGSGGDGDAAVWTSPDGETWTRVPHDEAVFGGAGDQSMGRVTVGGVGLVAVGYDYSDDDLDAAVWTSPDGVTWTRVPHDEVIFGGADAQSMLGVAAVGGGVVAVGFDYSGGDGDAAVWSSPDGATWTRMPHNEAIFGSPTNQRMADVVVVAGWVVAVGFDYRGGDGDAAVWTSPAW